MITQMNDTRQSKSPIIVVWNTAADSRGWLVRTERAGWQPLTGVKRRDAQENSLRPAARRTILRFDGRKPSNGAELILITSAGVPTTPPRKGELVKAKAPEGVEIVADPTPIRSMEIKTLLGRLADLLAAA